MKQFITNDIGSLQTLENVQDEKLLVYDTLEDAQDDLTNLEVGQIISTKSANDVSQITLEEWAQEYIDTKFTRNLNDTTWVDIKSSLTPLNGFTINSAYAFRKDNVVIFRASWTKQQDSTTSTTSVANGLPTKYRPVGGRAVYTVGLGYMSNTNEAFEVARCSIDGEYIQESERFISGYGSGATTVNMFITYFV